MELAEVKKRLPEYKKILEECGGNKPKKFIEAIKVVPCPAVFSPSDISDYEYRYSFLVDKNGIQKIAAYCYESMMASGVNPYERNVDVPRGSRMWVVTFNGMGKGFWRVQVFVHEQDLLPAMK